MKALLVRCLLVVTLGLLLLGAILLPGIKIPSSASAASPPDSANLAPESSFHLWKINEIFSCADGSIQFIEMINNSFAEDELQGHDLRATNLGGTQTNQFIFNSDLSSESTQNKTLLLATANFGTLPGGVTPDYTISSSFLFTQGGTLVFDANLDTFSYSAGELPLDGVQSLNRNRTTGTNSPKNFAGNQGSITCPPNLAVTKKASATVLSGTRITYTLIVTSTGATSNTTVILTDTIPSGTTFASAEVQPVNGVLTWTLGNLLPPSAVVSRTFAATVNVPAGSNVVNTKYGVRSNQVSASGLPVIVQVVGSQAIYLPIIFKNYPSLNEHDGVDSLYLPIGDN